MTFSCFTCLALAVVERRPSTNGFRPKKLFVTAFPHRIQEDIPKSLLVCEILINDLLRNCVCVMVHCWKRLALWFIAGKDCMLRYSMWRFCNFDPNGIYIISGLVIRLSVLEPSV